MSRFTDLVAATPLARDVFDPRRADGPLAIVCAPGETTAAARWCETTTGSRPQAVVTVGADRRLAPEARARLRDLTGDGATQVVVYGRKVRAKSIALAVAGIGRFFFAADPAFASHKHYPDYLGRYGKKLEQAAALLADEESLRVYASVVRQRLTGLHGYLRMADYPEYEHPLVRVLPGDWVIDGGASDGATSLRFARAAGRSGRMLAVEPDPLNLPLIAARRLVATGAHAPVKIVWTALGEGAGSIRFVAGRGASSRIGDGLLSVPMTSLDLLAERFDLSGPGVISLDIEGAEMAALKGGLAMIRRFRPKLQVSIYHRRTDLFEIPLLLARNLEGYRFFVGHHDAYHSETDLYACPD